MNVVFRADAGDVIGHGHVMRCLTLADQLREHGAHCEFVCRAHPGHLAERISARGYRVQLLPWQSTTPAEKDNYATWVGATEAHDASETATFLPRKIDWIVVDHYGLGATWEQALRLYCQRMLTIDDLANRQHDADLLLDSSLPHSEHDYRPLLLRDCEYLCGPEYALLAADFAQLRQAVLSARTERPLSRLLVSLGGGNSAGYIAQLLAPLREFLEVHPLQVEMILGTPDPALHRRIDEALKAAGIEAEIHALVGDMPQRLAAADIAIGAAGGSAYERASLGLPSVVLQLADNQAAQLHELARRGAAVVVEEPSQLAHALQTLLERHGQFQQQAAALCDGLGAQRVVSAMLNFATTRQTDNADSARQEATP